MTCVPATPAKAGREGSGAAGTSLRGKELVYAWCCRVGPGRHRGENSGEDLRGGRQAEAEDSELVGDTIRYETEPFSGGSVDGYLEVGVLEIDGSKEVAPSHRKKDRGGGLHLEGSLLYELVERGEVDHGSPASGRLLHQEEAAVEAGTWIGYSLSLPS